MVQNKNKVLKAQSRLFTIVLITNDMCAFILQPEKCCLLDKAYLEEVRSGSELVFGVFSRIVPLA